jgi:hypothetical protein
VNAQLRANLFGPGHPASRGGVFAQFAGWNERESVLFIGTQFSILYTSMYSPAEAITRMIQTGERTLFCVRVMRECVVYWRVMRESVIIGGL